MSSAPNRRILLVDDNASIHADYRKILGGGPDAAAAPSAARAAFFGEPLASPPAEVDGFELESAHQGEEGLERVRCALAEKRPYAVAFIDVRMPPGLDGVETARRLWELDPDVQVVICTAFADYTYEDLTRKLGRSDRLLILKKPFDPIEVVQLATALTQKWNTTRRERASVAELQRAVLEARAYAASISTINRALEAAKAGALASLSNRSDFLAGLAGVLQESTDALQLALELACEPGRSPELRARDLESSCACAHELARIARNLSMHTQLECETLVPESRAYSPGEQLDGLLARWRAPAQARGLRLTSECPTPLPAQVRGDPRLVAGLLDALVDNALHYTPSGSVRLELRMPARDEGQAPQLVFSVTDSGPGIPAEQQPRAFEAFARGAELPPPVAGAHLSLHIARRLARALGGDLECESTAGQGCCFRLEIPAGDLAGIEFGLHPPGPLPSNEQAQLPGEARR
jgi:signal transduction histidine kinase